MKVVTTVKNGCAAQSKNIQPQMPLFHILLCIGRSADGCVMLKSLPPNQSLRALKTKGPV